MYREFNNKIKKILIKKYCKDKVVFDIGAGVGGDIFKYYFAGAKFLYALEPDDEKIKEFKNRLPKEMLGKTQIIASRGETYTELKDVDVTVSMFSMTFFFENPGILNSFLNNIKGKYFIGVMLDGDELNKVLPENGTYSGDFFTFKRIEKNKISINLSDTATVKGDQIEWISSFTELVSKLKEKDYLLKESRLFNTFYNFSSLSKDEQKLIKLFRTFVFEKKI